MRFWLPLSSTPPPLPLPAPPFGDGDINSFGDDDVDDDDGNLGQSFTDWSLRFVSVDFCRLFSSPVFPPITELPTLVVATVDDDDDDTDVVVAVVGGWAIVADGAAIIEDASVLLSNDKIGFKILWLFDAVIVDDVRSTVSRDLVAFYWIGLWLVAQFSVCLLHRRWLVEIWK